MDLELRRQLLETWEIHARTVLYVLAGVGPAALAPTTDLKGRSAGSQFAHIHNVRLMWLQAAAPDLLSGLEKFGKEQALDKALLTAALERSRQAIGELLARALDSGRIKGFKPHPTAFLGYLIAHESFHQGDIGVRLTASGHPLDQKIAYGMWEWGTR
ncbi:MAG TPA: DinB family protein [Candidatus Dormibacteraeota bacterium]|nr:DinB family protein [Candidatus Dormibacteraeota bacterium]